MNYFSESWWLGRACLGPRFCIWWVKAIRSVEDHEKSETSNVKCARSSLGVWLFFIDPTSDGYIHPAWSSGRVTALCLFGYTLRDELS